AAKRRTSARKASGPTVANVVEGDFADRIAAHPEVCEAVNGVIHLDIDGKGGGQWTVDLSKAPGSVSRGFKGSPRMTVRANTTDFMALVEREKDAQEAVLAGELQLDPMDLSVAA